MNSNKSWVLRIDPSVYKKLKKIPGDYARRILKSIEALPNDPFTGDVQKLKDEENLWRRRIGSYRIFYKIDNIRNIIFVFHVERRTSSTY
ncbi:MAG: type II toxin-antitoxin system RelE/ParE family toxin [Patescibacteria group bacterium]